MKKIGLIFLSLMFVFTIACSGINPVKDEADFLERVKGKTTTGGMIFDDTGKTFKLGTGTETYTYKETKNSSSALYDITTGDASGDIMVLVNIADDDSVTISIVSTEVDAGILKQETNLGFLIK